MKIAGIAVAIAGLITAIIACFLPTTVSTPGLGADVWAPAGRAGDVYNLGKLQTQMMVFVAGCMLAAAGSVVAAIGTAVERLSLSVTSESAGEPELQRPAVEVVRDGAGRTEAQRSFDLLLPMIVGSALLMVVAIIVASKM